MQAQIKEPAWAGWLIRGFVLFMFGGIGIGSLVAAWSIAWGERPPRVPAAVLARCPACGEPWRAQGACGECGETRERFAGTWSEVQRDARPSVLLFGSAIGAGILCLGLFLAGEALFGDEANGVLAMIAYMALSLLLLAVGAVIAVAGLASLYAELRDGRTYTLSVSSEGHHVAATAQVARRKLVFSGGDHRYLPITRVPAPEIAPERLSPPRLALARAVAALQARGDVTTIHEEHRSWELGAGGKVIRTRVTEVSLGVSSIRPDDLPADAEPRDRLLAMLAYCEWLTQAAADMAAEPSIADAALRFAAQIGPDEIDPHVVAVLASVLGAPPPIGAYRSGGG